jgi:hypothetical protein
MIILQKITSNDAEFVKYKEMVTRIPIKTLAAEYQNCETLIIVYPLPPMSFIPTIDNFYFICEKGHQTLRNPKF